MTQLRSVTCHMGSHSVTCYPTQVNTPRLHPSQTGWCSIYRPFKGGGLSKLAQAQGAKSNWPTVATRQPGASEARTHDLANASPAGYRVGLIWVCTNLLTTRRSTASVVHTSRRNFVVNLAYMSNQLSAGQVPVVFNSMQIRQNSCAPRRRRH